MKTCSSTAILLHEAKVRLLRRCPSIWLGEIESGSLSAQVERESLRHPGFRCGCEEQRFGACPEWFHTSQGAQRRMRFNIAFPALGSADVPAALRGADQHKVIVDQDARGPATTDQQSMLMFIQSPDVDVLGITIVSGDMWRDEEVAHTLRMLELVGPHGHSGLSGRRVSAYQSNGIHRPLGEILRDGALSGRVERTTAPEWLSAKACAAGTTSRTRFRISWRATRRRRRPTRTRRISSFAWCTNIRMR